MSAIRGVPSKIRRGVRLYIEECFALDNEEVCHLFRPYLDFNVLHQMQHVQ